MPSAENGPARLVVVDDHDVVRSGLKAILSVQEGFEIVGEAVNGREALELCRRVRPDLILMDVRMPDVDGLAATQEIKQQFDDVKVLISLAARACTTFPSEITEGGARSNPSIAQLVRVMNPR